MSWDSIRFGDLYSEDSRNGLTKPSKVRGSGYKMINMGELFAMELVPLKDSEKKNAKVEKGDLLFARQSLVLEGAGKCCIVMDVSSLTVFESHLIRVRLDKTKANPLFYYYYFKSPFSPVSTIVSQCAQAGIRGSDLQELDVSFPPLPVQDRIASILTKYDELIENNQKQIKDFIRNGLLTFVFQDTRIQRSLMVFLLVGELKKWENLLVRSRELLK